MLTLMKMGNEVTPATDSSSKVWCFKKLKLDSEMTESLPRQVPGRGLGVRDLDIGSQLELTVSWSLNALVSNLEEVGQVIFVRICMTEFYTCYIVLYPSLSSCAFLYFVSICIFKGIKYFLPTGNEELR